MLRNLYLALFVVIFSTATAQAFNRLECRSKDGKNFIKLKQIAIGDESRWDLLFHYKSSIDGIEYIASGQLEDMECTAEKTSSFIPVVFCRDGAGHDFSFERSVFSKFDVHAATVKESSLKQEPIYFSSVKTKNLWDSHTFFKEDCKATN